MEPHPTTVEQFKQVTGADDHTARFFLSAANNDCDQAVSAFFESDGLIPSVAPPPVPTPAPAPAPTIPTPPPVPAPPVRSTTPGRGFGTMAGLGQRGTGVNRNRAGASSSSRRVATLGSLERERDDDEKGYYAGGEKSGQMIQPRRSTGDNNNDNHQANGEAEGQGEGEGGLAEAILERARQRGPRSEGERAEFEGTQRFAGAGYRLGDQAQQERPAAPSVIGRRNVTRVLTFYANGFRIDEGPLRPFDDPSNEAFLTDVNRGVVPKEMEQPGIGDVSITLVDKKDEDFVQKTSSRIVPFSGGGQRLDNNNNQNNNNNNNTTPSTSNSSHQQQQQQQQQQDDDDDDDAEATVVVDEQLPVVRVQVRLADGSRVVARLNESHTVGQLRQFVRASAPGVQQFDIATTFPRKVLTDDTATIKEAGLNGATVVQNRKN